MLFDNNGSASKLSPSKRTPICLQEKEDYDNESTLLASPLGNDDADADADEPMTSMGSPLSSRAIQPGHSTEPSKKSSSLFGAVMKKVGSSLSNAISQQQQQQLLEPPRRCKRPLPEGFLTSLDQNDLNYQHEENIY
jgi:hypothetical protein